MSIAALPISRSASLALALGLLGGTGLVLSAMFFASGKYILFPYAALVIFTAVVLKSVRVESYRERFGVGLSAFMLATVALYLFTHFVAVPRVQGSIPDISTLGHAWRLSLMLAIGAALNAAVARVSE